ncbi:hypothetical protein L1D24_20850 [Vibrio brasiliensis]|uniref:hypothetical protein n=1 Tax=Vibrio brasiliensis TaxID=170652 RepID=UPI001EFCD639|nr:hypothetical protein [Vibrio brasiliensis]MCG9650986.1 hypothetical protein [Vibrio brasiliensis]
MFVNKGKVVEEANTFKPSGAASNPILEAATKVGENHENSKAITALVKDPKGREILLSGAKADVYNKLMIEPEELNGRLYSKLATDKAFQYFKSVKSGFFEEEKHHEEYVRIRNEEQDRIDQALESLDIFKSPDSEEDLDTSLALIASRSGIEPDAVKKIANAIKAEKEAEVFKQLGLLKEEQQEGKPDQTEIIEKRASRGDGLSLISAGLLQQEMEGDQQG